MQSEAPRTPPSAATPGLTVLTTTRSVSGSAWQALSSRLPGSVLTSVQRWAVDSQRSACRNAMVAGTALAVRRAEREEVEEFLAARVPAPATEQSRLDALAGHEPQPSDSPGRAQDDPGGHPGHPGHTAHG